MDISAVDITEFINNHLTYANIYKNNEFNEGFATFFGWSMPIQILLLSISWSIRVITDMSNKLDCREVKNALGEKINKVDSDEILFRSNLMAFFSYLPAQIILFSITFLIFLQLDIFGIVCVFCFSMGSFIICMTSNEVESAGVGKYIQNKVFMSYSNKIEKRDIRKKYNELSQPLEDKIKNKLSNPKLKS